VRGKNKLRLIVRSVRNSRLNHWHTVNYRVATEDEICPFQKRYLTLESMLMAKRLRNGFDIAGGVSGADDL